MSVFEELNKLDLTDRVEKKSTGKKKDGKEETLTYLSWPWAWAEIKKRYPDASYEIVKFDGLPYAFDPKTGYMVYTRVTIEGITHEMWLPVMDGKMKAMKAEPYEYETKWGTNKVDAATMFDVNKTVMRCLVKNLAMFGLGLYIYAGEDLPDDPERVEKETENLKAQINVIKELCHRKGKSYEKYLQGIGKEESTLTGEDVGKMLHVLSELPDKEQK